MEPEFWKTAWEQGRIGFHRDEVHPDLHTWETRWLGEGSHRVLVPLCGKSVDLIWLRERGHEVVGVELVDQAVEQFHDDHWLEPEVQHEGDAAHWRTERLTLVCGDFFELEPGRLGTFDRVWDRAALVAIDPAQRGEYAQRLQALMGEDARLLLNTFEYDQSKMQGPPWSVPADQVRALFEGWAIEVLERRDAARQISFEGHDHWWVTTWLIGPRES